MAKSDVCGLYFFLSSIYMHVQIHFAVTAQRKLIDAQKH